MRLWVGGWWEQDWEHEHMVESRSSRHSWDRRSAGRSLRRSNIVHTFSNPSGDDIIMGIGARLGQKINKRYNNIV